MEIRDLKVRYPIALAWRDLGLPGQPGKCVCSPFREDRSPSFSVFAGDDGERFHDFATAESGDVFDFVARARGCNTAEAIAFVRERLGIVREQRRPEPPRPRPAPVLPTLRAGTDAELRQLSERRGFCIEALTLAQERGFLFFSELWGHPAWCITDQRRQLHEFRRVDCEKWLAYGRLPARKCHCLGHGKEWPIGTLESTPFGKIAWVEGAPDLLAAFHYLRVERKLETVAPVGILGASNRALAPEALAQFKGKAVCLYPHADDAGRQAARIWARQLKDAGAGRVTAFDLSGLMKVDGTTGKDLADVAFLSAESFECEAKWQEVMP
ncbi:MAG: hypothetical protein EBS05_08330 [Proteobacteria bacterium]|nr:hypothetical protein [Pseudomonadota bacterium]